MKLYNKKLLYSVNKDQLILLTKAKFNDGNKYNVSVIIVIIECDKYKILAYNT